MKIPADGVWDRLRFKVIEEARQISPAGTSSQFDESGPQHDSEDHPPVEPEDNLGRRGRRKGSWIKERNKEDGQKACLQEHDLPAVSVEDLSDMDKGKVDHPEESERDSVGQPSKKQQGQPQAQIRH